MLTDNSFQLIGTIYHKESMKIIDKTGLAVLEMEVDVTEMWKNNQGGWEKKVYTIPVSVFGEKAKSCSDRLAVGTTVRIAGKIRSRTKETRNGGKFLSLHLVADEIQAHSPPAPPTPPRQTYQDPELPF